MPSKKLILIFTGFCLFASSVAFSQSWIDLMQNKELDFYSIQKKFHKKYDRIEKEQKREKTRAKKEEEGENEISGGWMQFKRWENFMEPRVYPAGKLINPAIANDEYQKYITTHTSQRSMGQTGSWISLGSSGAPSGGGGVGRVNNVRFDPINSNIIYACAPAGGLWKSVNGGTTWTTNTDHIGVIGVTDIAIHPDSTNILYIATGDGEATDTYSAGVLKSLDGGTTWNSTGLNWNVSQTRSISKLLMEPGNSNVLYAAASNGLYKTSDGGNSWFKVFPGAIKDIEFKPGHPKTIFAATTSGLFLSNNSGATFTRISSGLPSSNVERVSIAVTPDDSDYVYLLAGASSDHGLEGLYLSTDGGNTFNKKTDSFTPNIMGWDQYGSDTGGQSWYSLSLAVAPDDKNFIITGGVNIWASYDGGVTWNVNSNWYGSGSSYVHADIHGLDFSPAGGNTYFASTDGGVFKTSNGSYWNDISGNMSIGQMYRLGSSATDPDIVIQGWQDNGTSMYNAGSWDRIMGGDGMECFIDYTDNNYMYAEFYNGDLQASDNGGAWFSSITSGLSGNAAWVTPWVMDPYDPTTLYVGYEDVFRSSNRGNSWTKISGFWGGGTLIALAVAPSNTNYIYAASSGKLHKTTNGGTSWTDIDAGLPSSAITYIAINSSDPDNIWVTLSGYVQGKKVYETKDGGATWINISGTLPNLPVNCIVYQQGSANALYIGTDVGVYYKDSTLTDWKPYSTGLPNVIVDELEIQYSSGKLRAATYGRGLWETGLFNPNSLVPAANFTSDKLSGCPGVSIQFTDQSTNNPVSWSWSFPGGSPASSASQNPVVVYNTPGSYNDVSLFVTNANGNDSLEIENLIAVSPGVTPSITADGPLHFCAGGRVGLTASSANLYSWTPGGSNYKLTAVNSGAYSVTTTDAFGCVLTSPTVVVTVDPKPSAPVITLSGDTLFSSYLTGNQWILNGSPISLATDSIYIITQSGNYSVTYSDSNGCFSTSQVMIVTGINKFAESPFDLKVIPNPNNGNFLLSFNNQDNEPLTIKVINVLGETVYLENLNNFKGTYSKTIQLAETGKGVYLLLLGNSEGVVSRKILVDR